MKRKHKHDFKLLDGEEVCDCGLIKPVSERIKLFRKVGLNVITDITTLINETKTPEDDNRSEGGITVEQPESGESQSHPSDVAISDTDSTSSGKRINISLSEEVHSAWSKIKGNKSWNMLLTEALKLYDEVKELKDLIREALVNRPVITQIISDRQLSQIPGAHYVQAKRVRPVPKDRPEFIKELIELAEKHKDDGIKSILKDHQKEAKKDKKLDDNKINKLKEAAIKRELKRRKRHLKPPAGVS